MAAQLCADLLSGADPLEYPDVLPYLGGRAAAGVLDGRSRRDWARVWGARGLLYVWTDGATGAVVRGLADRSWRVGENCLKVSTLREIAPAGPGATRLAGHRLARIRAQAIRTLGVVGDTEHVGVVRLASEDPDGAVHQAAKKALHLLVERLDLPIGDFDLQPAESFDVPGVLVVGLRARRPCGFLVHVNGCVAAIAARWREVVHVNGCGAANAPRTRELIHMNGCETGWARQGPVSFM